MANQTTTVQSTLSTRHPGLFFRGTEPDTSGTPAQQLCGPALVGRLVSAFLTLGRPISGISNPKITSTTTMTAMHQRGQPALRRTTRPAMTMAMRIASGAKSAIEDYSANGRRVRRAASAKRRSGYAGLAATIRSCSAAIPVGVSLGPRLWPWSGRGTTRGFEASL